MGGKPQSFADIHRQKKTSMREKIGEWRIASHLYPFEIKDPVNISTELQLLQNQLDNAEQSLQQSQDRHLESQRRHREESARYMDCSIQLQKLADQGATFVSFFDCRSWNLQVNGVADCVSRTT
jgi:hypothetical protein